MASPRLVIVGGSNGAGKSTFAVTYARAEDLPFLNADLLTKQFADAGEAQPLVKAARTFFFTRLDDTLRRGESVCIETTLSGGYIHGVVARAQQLGYRVELVYLYVADVEVAIARVASRVRKGGHDVPEPDIRRRFAKSIANFVSLSKELDMWELYESTTSQTELIAKRVDAEEAIFSPAAFARFSQNFPNP